MGYSGWAVPLPRRLQRQARRTNAGTSPRQATRICDGSQSKRPGAIGSGRQSGPCCASDRRECRKRSRRLPGKRNSGCTNATPGWRRLGRTRERSLPRWGANCSALSGRSGSRRKQQPGSRWQSDENKSKNDPKNEKAKTAQRMNSTTIFEDRAGSSRGAHEGESSHAYATGAAGLATLVRGSSRRITIMRFRPANIRLINRRSNLPRLLLALSSKKDKTYPTNSKPLTGSLHIRAFTRICRSESD